MAQDLAYAEPSTDPAVIALRRQTQAIRDMVASMQSADLAARAQGAENARRALDTTFRLTSGTGFGVGRGPSTDETDTLLTRLPVRPVSSASRVSGANPYVSASTAVPGAAPVTAQTVLAQATPGAGRSNRVIQNLR